MQNIWNVKATDGLRKVGSIPTSGSQPGRPRNLPRGPQDYFNLKALK